jgi:membrane glycosyltransferase
MHDPSCADPAPTPSGATTTRPDPTPAAPRPSAGTMRARRVVFALLVVSTVAALLALMARALDADGLDTVDVAILAAFGITLPWTAVGFWNATIGLLLRVLCRDPLGVAAPAVRAGRTPSPIDTRTAILVCIRNEDTLLIERNLNELLGGLGALRDASALQVFLLSDSDRPAIVAAEAAMAAALARRHAGGVAVTYRRRDSNPGYKAGNIRDFCERWGASFDFAVVLDADSVMTPAAILRLIRVMQAEPTYGIVQTLVVGLPSASPFARTFQFGMRLGMRSYTLGSAWWQGDCGPYWGHNAIIRLAPFIAHCELPMLRGTGPLSGAVLSHDQVEAVLMRRAGYEVRVLPLEEGSWEENPPTLLEFARRDLRWCQGNLQYARLLRLPGLRPISRCQLVLAMLMFAGSPAWLAMIVLATFRDLLVTASGPTFRPDVGAVLIAIILTMVFAPKIASIVAVLARPRRREFGPPGRFLAGVGVEVVFSVLLAPIMAVAHTVFIAGLAFGRTIGWSAQVRTGHGVAWRAAAGSLWLQTLVGALLCAWFVHTAPGAALLFLPFCGPLMLAIPFAVASAWPALGIAMVRARIAAIPEEIRTPPELQRLDLPALAARRPDAGTVAHPSSP